ncbi:GntP family permease [Romboutsia sp.]|uniref:GntP family permease n=1 Tax=Romboutsia sp. TaxID=1965302 RepID=UPI003F3B5710
MIAVFGLIISVILLIYLSFKGYPMLFSTIVCSVILAVFGGMALQPDMLAIYGGGLGAFFGNNVLLFTMGALFGKLLGESKAAISFSYKILDVLGEQRALLAIYVASFVLTWAGVNNFVLIFALYPIMVALCSRTNIPKKLGLAAFMSGSFIPMAFTPGSATNMNVILADTLGTSMYAGAGIGAIGTVIATTLALTWLKYEESKCRSEAERFVAADTDIIVSLDDKDGLPSFSKSAIPLLALIVGIIALSKNMASMPAIVFSLVISSAIAFVLFNKSYPNKVATISQGLAGGINPLLAVATISGFSAVIEKLPVFSTIVDSLFGLGLNPLILLFIVMAILSGIMGNAISPVAFFASTLADKFVAAGIAPSLLHRMVTMGSTSLSCLPNSGGLLSIIEVCKLTLKDCYREVAIATMVIPSVTAMICTVIAMFM